MKLAYAAVILAALIASLFGRPCRADILQATSLGIGAGGGWLTRAGETTVGNAEAFGKAAVSVTPHVSLVGSIAYGFQSSYLRGAVGGRITATDVNDRTFSVGVGVSRHFASEPNRSLDEWAGEAAVGWQPIASSEFLLTASAARGLTTGDGFLTAAIVYPLVLTGGGK